MAYCYIGRWLYLEACILLPDIAPYLQSTLEALDPPTHDRIIELIKSNSIPETIDRGIENLGIENLTPHHTNPKYKTKPSDDSEALSDDYF